MAKKLVCLTPREYESGGQTKTAFTRCGVAFKTEAGNLSVMLDALPVNGKLVIMPDKDRPAQTARPAEDDDIPF